MAREASTQERTLWEMMHHFFISLFRVAINHQITQQLVDKLKTKQD
jgi:hypothetical protein